MRSAVVTGYFSNNYELHTRIKNIENHVLDYIVLELGAICMVD